MSENPDVLVLRQGTHGLPAEKYTTELRERLPDHRIELARTPRQERELIPSASVVSTVEIDEELLSYAEELELFAGVAAGYGHLPLETFEEIGVTVTTASGIHAPNIAEQVLGYILTMTRRLREGWRREQRHEWRHYQASELQGSTVTVVGLGSIGSAMFNGSLDSKSIQSAFGTLRRREGRPTRSLASIRTISTTPSPERTTLSSHHPSRIRHGA